MAYPFQQRVVRWCRAAFGDKDTDDKRMRSLRFIEEAVELVQATGLTEEEAIRVLKHVYAKPVGKVHQEIGGVMVTFATLVSAHGLAMYQCGEDELARCWLNIEKIRVRHANKPKFDGTDQFPEAAKCPCGAALIMRSEKESGHCSECVRIRS